MLKAFNDTTWNYELKSDWKDKIDICIGDDKQPDFKPQVKIMRWDNEVNCSFQLKHSETSPTNSQIGDRIKWIGKKVEADFYSFGDESEGGYEFEVTLKEKPKTNKVEFTLETKGIDFFYQGELTQEEIAEGAIRPENVVGSYAIYASEEKNNIAGGKEYRCGKVGHIYRPRISDSAGKKVWGEVNVDTKNKLLTVTIPQDFIDTAVYPIRHAAGLTLGFTTMGATVTLWGADTWRAKKGTASASGNITGWSVYLSDGSSAYIKGVMCDNSLNILTNGVANAVGPVGSTVGDNKWWNGTFTVNPSVTSGQNYWAGGIGSGSVYGYYDTVASNGTDGRDLSNSYTTPTNPTDADVNRTTKFSIYFTYEAPSSSSRGYLTTRTKFW